MERKGEYMTEQTQGETIVSEWQVQEIVRQITLLAKTSGFGSLRVVVQNGHVRFFEVTHSIEAVREEANK